MTINTTAAQAQRIAKAFGRLKNLRESDKTPRDATANEIKADVIEFIRSTVINYEQDVAMQAASKGVSDIDPT